jgi:hypothetical protein
MRWSSTVEDYYPVAPRPRWGRGSRRHSGLQAVLERSRPDFERELATIAEHRSILHSVQYDRNPEDATTPHWNNVWFSSLDAASLMGFLLARKPKRYLEIGSGHSTMFARYAIQAGKLPTTITSIDPRPREEIDKLCDRTLRQSLEDCDLSCFEELEKGDLLFFDGSHRVFTNSDVTVFFLEILTKLEPGVLVHIHDIFLPADYPRIWNRRLYSEQYLLAAMLLCGAPPFRVVLPNYFVCTDADLGARVRAIFKSETGDNIPFVYNTGSQMPGVSFWLETAAVGRAGP